MNDSALVATRKGLFRLHRKGKNDWDLELLGFRGDPVSIAFTDPRTRRMHAALNLGHFGVKLHRSDDQGKTWTESAVPAYPEQPEKTDDKKKGKSLVQIWALTHGGKDRPGVLWAGTIPGGLFRSDDNGETWTLNEALWNVPGRETWFGGGYDDAGIHSVCVDPRNSDHVSVAVSCGGVWLSEDAGASWTCKTQGMYAEYMPPDRREDPIIQDPHIMVQSPSHPDVFWVQHHNGVFRSRNRAEAWDDISPNAQPSKFGFVVAVHPQDPETAWFAPAIKDECRIPVDGLVVSRTRDGGKTFELLRDGLPQKHAYDLIYRHAMDVDDSGDRLAMGSTTGGLWVSENAGDSWSCVSAHLPPIYAVRFEKAV